MALSGDLDTDCEIIESVRQFHGLRIGNQEIITSGEAFLPTPTPPLNLTFNSMPFFTILPITARQTDEAGSPAIGTQYIDLEGNTNTISVASEASLIFPDNLNDITSSIQMADGIVPITASINNNKNYRYNYNDNDNYNHNYYNCDYNYHYHYSYNYNL